MSKTRSKVGRPPKATGPKLPHEEVERLLIEGERVTCDDGIERRVWPSQRQVADRYDVAPSLVAAFAKQYRCTERRSEFQAALPADDAVTSASKPPAPAPEEERRKPGRPRKQDAPLIPYEELDRLLVFGEVEVLEDGTTTTVYPSYRTLSERYGVVPSIIAGYAKSHNCIRRRKQVATRIAVRTEDKLIEQRAEVLAVGEDRLISMIDDFLLKFESALKEGRVRTDSPADVNTLARLKTFIMGGADSRAEVRSILSLEALQERYARMRRDAEEATPAMAGVIDAHAQSSDGETEHETKESNAQFEDSDAPFDDSSAHFEGLRPPGRVIEEADAELTEETLELVDLVRELVGAKVGELEERALRIVKRVEARLGPRDGDGEEG